MRRARAGVILRQRGHVVGPGGGTCCSFLTPKRVPRQMVFGCSWSLKLGVVKPHVRKNDPGMTQFNTATVDAILHRAADLVGTGPFSRRLATVADAWTADKEAAASTADLVETNGAILRAGQLRIREAVGVVQDAAAVEGPSM